MYAGGGNASCISQGENMAGTRYSQLTDVTPDDSNDLSVSGILYIGTAGDVKVTAIDGGVATFKHVLSGEWIEQVRVKRVWATGTTATNIIIAS